MKHKTETENVVFFRNSKLISLTKAVVSSEEIKGQSEMTKIRSLKTG